VPSSIMSKSTPTKVEKKSRAKKVAVTPVRAKTGSIFENCPKCGKGIHALLLSAHQAECNDGTPKAGGEKRSRPETESSPVIPSKKGKKSDEQTNEGKEEEETKEMEAEKGSIVEYFKEKSWLEHLAPEFKKSYFKSILSALDEAKKNGKTVYPPEKDIFNAFNFTPFDKLKVVIIGQDPYHGAGQAHGIAFSVNKGVAVPSSLQNIYKELTDDIQGFKAPNHGNLVGWAKQGVLLLNATLTVEAGNANSHAKIGWQTFTNTVIQEINSKKENVVFLLWGNFAQKKAAHVDGRKHYILKSPHPSFFSADKFFGNKHFSKANEYLKKHNIEPIDWSKLD